MSADGQTDQEPVAGELAGDPERRPFAAFLTEHRRGALHAELSESLATLASAVLEHGKTGTLTMTVKLHPNKDGHTVTVSDDVKVLAPQGDRGASLWFADSRGNLSRKNPLQTELPLREAGKEN